MHKICQDCGREFIAIRPHFLICIDCYGERIRTQRAALFVPRVRDLTSRPKNKLRILGGDRDAMPG